MKVGRKNIPGRKGAWYKSPKWEKARQVGEWGREFHCLWSGRGWTQRCWDQSSESLEGHLKVAGFYY